MDTNFSFSILFSNSFSILQKQTAVVNSHSEVDTSSLEKEINKLKEEKSQLMERIKKSNEENLKAIDKYNVSIFKYVYILKNYNSLKLSLFQSWKFKLFLPFIVVTRGIHWL